MILEWDNLFYLISSVDAAGTSPGLPNLPLNQPVELGTQFLGWYMLDPAKCQAGAARRITRNNLAQADGEIKHKKFKSGYVVELNVQFWENPNADPACAGVLRQMADTLGEYLEAIANNDGQLVWQPSGWPVNTKLATAMAQAGYPNPRMLDQCRSMGPSGSGTAGASFVSVVAEKDPNAKLIDVTFALLSPFPYLTDYMDWPTSPDATVEFATDPVPPLGMGPAADSSVTIYNDGNVEYFPRIHVLGPSSEVTITNTSVLDETGAPLQIQWSQNGSGPISGSGWLELDLFLDTAYLNDGSGYLTNAKGGINALNSDFFPLAPGPNVLTIDKEASLDVDFYQGDGVIVYYRNAWE